MSFSETFHPDNEFSKIEEDAKYHIPEKGVDGAKVGGDSFQNKRNQSDRIGDNDVDGYGGENIKRVPSIEALASENSESKMRLSEVAKNKPDWPPAKGNPEAESRIAGDLENSLNQVA